MTAPRVITIIAACWSLVLFGAVLTQLMLGRVVYAVALIVAVWFIYQAGRLSAKPSEPQAPETKEGGRLDRYA